MDAEVALPFGLCLFLISPFPCSDVRWRLAYTRPVHSSGGTASGAIIYAETDARRNEP